LPAVIQSDGTKYWYVNGQLHRDNGLPAIEYITGEKSYYIDGKEVLESRQPTLTEATNEELLQELARRLGSE